MKQQEFFARGANMLLVAGVFAIAAGLFSLMVTGHGLSAATGILIVAVGLWQKNNPILRFEATHLVWRPAMLRAQTLVSYQDIKDVNVENPKVVVVAFGAERPMKIPLGAFAKDERQLVVEQLKASTSG